MPQVIKINAITVPAGSGDELGKRFAARKHAVDGVDGFEGFELLQPTDERSTWLVITRWRDEAAFEAWKNSPAFAHGHRTSAGDNPHQGGSAPEGAHGHADTATHGAAHGHGSSESESEGGERQRPVGMSAELWSFVPSVASERE